MAAPWTFRVPVNVSVTCTGVSMGAVTGVVVVARSGEAQAENESGERISIDTSEIQSYLIKLPGFRKDSSE